VRPRLEHLRGCATDHHLAADHLRALELEPAEVLLDPLGGELVRLGRAGLVAVERDRQQLVAAAIDRLVGHESRLLRERVGEVDVDAVHEVVDGAGTHAVTAQTGVHRPSSRTESASRA
jgi:hypothetical protein